MLFELFLKGLLIGVILGVPAGAIGALTIQRTIDDGLKGGFISGAGSCTADLFFAMIGVFGVTIISDFLDKHEFIIEIIGGILIAFLGFTIIRKRREIKTKYKMDPKLESKLESKPGGDYLVYYFSSFGAAILNPGTMVAFMIAFTSFDITEISHVGHAIVLIIGILLGTFSWWVILCGLVTIFRNKIDNKLYRRINYVLGSLVFIFGIVILAQGIIGLAK